MKICPNDYDKLIGLQIHRIETGEIGTITGIRQRCYAITARDGTSARPCSRCLTDGVSFVIGPTEWCYSLFSGGKTYVRGTDYEEA